MAYSQWAPEHARNCADAADAAFAVGSRAGSLQGIPTSIKDLFAVAGFPTYAARPGASPPKFEIDGPVVANLRRQLATVIGKTHMVEFAFGGTGQNAHYGSPYNPWDATAHRSPGGSSSGAGVSLCEGSALFGLRQRYRGLGALARRDDRQCRVKIHQGSLVERRDRTFELLL